jgi:glycosyltransferase involved in cell wall biosynthesis
MLKRTLQTLCEQETQDTFTYSLVVVDNDCRESARHVVAELRDSTYIDIRYCVEPEQNIALARNRALQHTTAEYVAFIDDDEFPTPVWLLNLLRTCKKHGVAGVLGPVRPFFDNPAPNWLLRSELCVRAEYATGRVLHWKQTRTGNVLFRREIIDAVTTPFRPEFGNGGEDQDFFRRMMHLGHEFVWCNEAAVYEFVPPDRRTRRFYFKRALLRGQNEKLLLSPRSILKSAVAIPLYTMMLPFLMVLSQHRAMQFAVRLCDHLGKLLAAGGISPIRGKYLG